MKLYLTRHGDAVSSETDSNRPLSQQGVTDITRVADYNKKSNNQVTRIIHSKKLRAQQTAEILATAMLSGSSVEVNTDINPNDPLEPLLQVITELNEDTLIVGHLPYMSYLVASLTGDPETLNKIRYTPGTMVCLDLAAANHGPWKINWVVQPENLN